jgi:hypothetical protein
MEVDDEKPSTILVESGAGDDDDNIDEVCVDEREIHDICSNRPQTERNRIMSTTTFCRKMEISEENFCKQCSDDDANNSGPITFIGRECSEPIVHPSSSSLLVTLSARMKLQADMGNTSLVAGRKKGKLVTGDLQNDDRGPLSLQAVTNGVPTIQSLHTALLKHGMYQHLVFMITALYAKLSNSPHPADNAMALIRGTKFGHKKHRAVHMSAADDLLLQIPSFPISSVSSSKGRIVEVVAKSALNFLQKSILIQEPSILKKLSIDEEKIGPISLKNLSLFRTFAKSSSALMAPMVRHPTINHYNSLSHG